MAHSDDKLAGGELAEARARFLASLEKARTKSPLRRSAFATDAGIALEDLYTPVEGAVDYLQDLGFPGQYPFTRGVQPTMYRGRFWTMRQYAGFGTARESNQRYRYLLSQGQTGLSVAFDLPTQMGRDPDSPLARGEVGRVGVSIASLDDMQVLLDGLPLGEISTSMTINATAATLLALYVAVADARGVSRGQLQGTIQNDILKEYIARGTYIYPPRPSLRLTVDTFAFCKAELPKWNTISISGYHIREAGSDAVQEVAFTLADGIAYVEAALEAGLQVDEFATRLSFFFNVHNNFLEEVAKYRAARRLWAWIMRERFGAKDPRSWALRFHAQTAGSTLQAQQPLCNLLRVTLQAFAAVAGGAQSLHTNAYDEALALPTETSALLALRTQQVIAYESGMADMVDPLGGSYALEALTDEIERRARGYIERIEKMGGTVAAIESRFIQREIEVRAYEYQRAIEEKQKVIVGVNEFTMTEPPPAGLQRIDPRLEATRVEEVRRTRRERDDAAAREALGALERAARTPPASPAEPGADNLVARILACVKARATVGEIADRLRAVFGEYRESAS
ncbi:MAG TPA: methylmalonyl-CoA mutase family protein [Polyangia bacterium]|nr:methylmalonyl-CoA mutase family protein [Polyangia bacterium]